MIALIGFQQTELPRHIHARTFLKRDIYLFIAIQLIFHLVWLLTHIQAFLSSTHHLQPNCTYILYPVCNGFIHFVFNLLLFCIGSSSFNSAMECRNYIRKVNRFSTLTNEIWIDQAVHISNLTMQYNWFPPLGISDNSLRSSPSGITFSMFKW